VWGGWTSASRAPYRPPRPRRPTVTITVSGAPPASARARRPPPPRPRWHPPPPPARRRRGHPCFRPSRAPAHRRRVRDRRFVAQHGSNNAIDGAPGGGAPTRPLPRSGGHAARPSAACRRVGARSEGGPVSAPHVWRTPSGGRPTLRSPVPPADRFHSPPCPHTGSAPHDWNALLTRQTPPPSGFHTLHAPRATAVGRRRNGRGWVRPARPPPPPPPPPPEPRRRKDKIAIQPPSCPIPHPNGVWMGRRWAIPAHRKLHPIRTGMGTAAPPRRGFGRVSRSETAVHAVPQRAEMHAANDDWILDAVRFDNRQFPALTTDVEPKFIDTARWRRNAVVVRPQHLSCFASGTRTKKVERGNILRDGASAEGAGGGGGGWRRRRSGVVWAGSCLSSMRASVSSGHRRQRGGAD